MKRYYARLALVLFLMLICRSVFAETLNVSGFNVMKRWSPSRFSDGPARVGGAMHVGNQIFVMTADGLYQAGDDDPTRWRALAGFPLEMSPGNDALVTGSKEAMIFAASTDANSDQLFRWSEGTGVESLRKIDGYSPRIAFATLERGCVADDTAISMTIDGGKSWLEPQTAFTESRQGGGQVGVFRVNWLSSDLLAVGGDDGYIVLFAVDRQGHMKEKWRCCISPRDVVDIVSGDHGGIWVLGDSSLSLLDGQTGQTRTSWPVPSGLGWRLVVSGKWMYIAARDRSLYLYELGKELQLKASLKDSVDPLLVMPVAGGPECVVITGNGEVLRWDGMAAEAKRLELTIENEKVEAALKVRYVTPRKNGNLPSPQEFDEAMEWQLKAAFLSGKEMGELSMEILARAKTLTPREITLWSIAKYKNIVAAHEKQSSKPGETQPVP